MKPVIMKNLCKSDDNSSIYMVLNEPSDQNNYKNSCNYEKPPCQETWTTTIITNNMTFAH